MAFTPDRSWNSRMVSTALFLRDALVIPWTDRFVIAALLARSIFTSLERNGPSMSRVGAWVFTVDSEFVYELDLWRDAADVIAVFSSIEVSAFLSWTT